MIWKDNTIPHIFKLKLDVKKSFIISAITFSVLISTLKHKEKKSWI
jgi:hypothetical protein